VSRAIRPGAVVVRAAAHEQSALTRQFLVPRSGGFVMIRVEHFHGIETRAGQIHDETVDGRASMDARMTTHRRRV
jgi:hypothetical protein